MNQKIIDNKSIFDEIEKKLYYKRQYFKILDNLLLPFVIVFGTLVIVSFLLLLYSGNLINEYVDNQLYKNLNAENKESILKYLMLWVTNNQIGLVTGNTGGAFGILLFIVLLMELIGSKVKKESIEFHKKNIMIATSVYSFVISLIVFIALNTSGLPININDQSQTFMFFANNDKINFFTFLYFPLDSGYNDLMNPNFDGVFAKGDYVTFFITFSIIVALCSITSICYLAFFFIWNIKNKKYLNLRIDDLEIINDSIKKIEDYKEIDPNKDSTLNYFEKQTQFFEENKNKLKKVPNNIVYTQEIDMNKKESRKLTLKETEDKDSINPNPSKRTVEKLKKKRKIDDLFLKDT